MSIKNLTTNSNEVIALEDLLGQIEIPRLKRNLRKLLLHYLMNEHENLMPNFEDFIEDLMFFFEFLDALNGDVNPKGYYRDSEVH